MKNNILEFITGFGLIVLAVLVLNPSHLWMPDMVLMLLLVAVLAVFCLLAVFVMREGAVDEREIAHRALAGRAAFLVGSTVLVVGIIAEGMTHVVDPWLVLALIFMVLGKIGARVYSDLRL
jgi:uncharacterized membrane protein YfcA